MYKRQELPHQSFFVINHYLSLFFNIICLNLIILAVSLIIIICHHNHQDDQCHDQENPDDHPHKLNLHQSPRRDQNPQNIKERDGGLMDEKTTDIQTELIFVAIYDGWGSSKSILGQSQVRMSQL